MHVWGAPTFDGLDRQRIFAVLKEDLENLPEGQEPGPDKNEVHDQSGACTDRGHDQGNQAAGKLTAADILNTGSMGLNAIKNFTAMFTLAQLFLLLTKRG